MIFDLYQQLLLFYLWKVTVIGVIYNKYSEILLPRFAEIYWISYKKIGSKSIEFQMYLIHGFWWYFILKKPTFFFIKWSGFFLISSPKPHNKSIPFSDVVKLYCIKKFFSYLKASMLCTSQIIWCTYWFLLQHRPEKRDHHGGVECTRVHVRISGMFSERYCSLWAQNVVYHGNQLMRHLCHFTKMCFNFL